jgi:hypothetical protein
MNRTNYLTLARILILPAVMRAVSLTSFALMEDGTFAESRRRRP